jgi:hypothetical protein
MGTTKFSGLCASSLILWGASFPNNKMINEPFILERDEWQLTPHQQMKIMSIMILIPCQATITFCSNTWVRRRSIINTEQKKMKAGMWMPCAGEQFT